MANTVIKRTFVFSIILVVLCSFCPSLCLHHHIARCEKIRPCACEFPSGEGIDLSIISNPNNTLSANLTSNTTVYFQPCDVIKLQNVSNCNLTSLCLFNKTNNQSTSLGNPLELKFLSENEAQPVQLQFQNGDIISTVDLNCSDNGTTFTGNQEGDKKFHFTLTSPAACVRALEVHPARSMISVLLISSLIVLCTYLIAMIIVRHSRGAVGWEVLPHYEFFTRLPSLCRAGCTSILSCCRLQPSYEQI